MLLQVIKEVGKRKRTKYVHLLDLDQYTTHEFGSQCYESTEGSGYFCVAARISGWTKTEVGLRSYQI
jgi:hypothetical protein